ncbi:hypothetical protein BDV11DRAFT_7127 [Aspergillus similis]
MKIRTPYHRGQNQFKHRGGFNISAFANVLSTIPTVCGEKLKYEEEFIVKRDRTTGPGCRNPILAQKRRIYPRSIRACIGFCAVECPGHEPIKREVPRSSPLHLPPRRDSKIKAFTAKEPLSISVRRSHKGRRKREERKANRVCITKGIKRQLSEQKEKNTTWRHLGCPGKTIATSAVYLHSNSEPYWAR